MMLTQRSILNRDSTGSAHSVRRRLDTLCCLHNRNHHFYTTEILFQTEKEVSKIKLVYASNADHLLHSSYPYPLDQRELVDKNDNF